MKETMNKIKKHESDTLEPTTSELIDSNVASFYSSFNESLEAINKKFTNVSCESLEKGTHFLDNRTIVESKTFDDEFLNVLEAAYPAFSKITKDPKRSIKYENDIVSVEKARKISSQTIEHLASHTQFIREVKKDGFVIPDKLLTSFAEEDLEIYENRVFKTLIDNIIRFLYKRMDVLSENIESTRTDLINYNNNVMLKDGKVEVSLNVKLTKMLSEETAKSERIKERTAALKQAYEGLRGTPFLRAIAKCKPVHSPLLKTNIILHNAEFKIVYNTWIFMERYSREPYGVEVVETKYDADNSTVEKDFTNAANALLSELLYYRKANSNDKIESAENISAPVQPEFEITHRFNLNPGIIEAEKYYPSELFLTRTLEYFNQTFENQQTLNENYTELSARNTFKEILNIVNNITPNLFGYKDNDLDVLTNSTEANLALEERRFELLKLLREEKERDLELTKAEEERALNKVNELRALLDQEEESLEILQRRQSTLDMQKELDEAFDKAKEIEEAQKEAALRNKDKLEELARLRALQMQLRGFHSKYKAPKQKIKPRFIQIFDPYDDDILNLFDYTGDFKLVSKRDFINYPYKTYNEIMAMQILKEAREKEYLIEICKAFKNKKKAKKAKQNKRKLTILDDFTTLDDLFGVPDFFDIYQKKFKHLHKKKKLKVVGKNRKLVSKRTLSKEELLVHDLKNKKKVIGKTKVLVGKRTLVGKKTISVSKAK